jgi:hypothetical protein
MNSVAVFDEDLKPGVDSVLVLNNNEKLERDVPSQVDLD